jgi:Sulfotransferase family
VTPEALLGLAQERTGLFDFGPEGWQEGFAHMVEAIETELAGDLDVVRRAEDVVLKRLVNRLRIEGWYADHGAEAGAHPVEGPLVVLGTGRSGTTAAHYLLALDPQFRYLRKWEIEDPVPPPDASTEQHDDRRPVSVQRTAQHIATVDGPTEDRRIAELAFRDDGRTLPIQSYTDWWREADHSPGFVYHERILRMLHSHRPPHRWLLKSPDYLFTLPPLLAQYPDIRFVMMHRDPVKVVPSVCSVTVEAVRRRLPDWRYDPDTYGGEFLNHLGEGVRRFMRVREEVGEEVFVDVGQPELEVDPLGVADRVYEFAGLDLSSDVRATMLQWSEENRAGSRGEHSYTLEEYGLTEVAIREVFADYIDRFGDYFTVASGA